MKATTRLKRKPRERAVVTKCGYVCVWGGGCGCGWVGGWVGGARSKEVEWLLTGMAACQCVALHHNLSVLTS